jgi:hypothetical protein
MTKEDMKWNRRWSERHPCAWREDSGIIEERKKNRNTCDKIVNPRSYNDKTAEEPGDQGLREENVRLNLRSYLHRP